MAGGRFCQGDDQPAKQNPNTNEIEAAGLPRAKLARALAKAIRVVTADALHEPD